MGNGVQVGLTTVIVAVAGAVPRVVVVRGDFEFPSSRQPFPPGVEVPPTHRDALPEAPFEPARWRSLQEGVRVIAEANSGLSLGYVEQLYTFGDRHRDPREVFGAARALVVGYLALVADAPLGGGAAAEWRDLYAYFPWEDWRDERPALIDQVILPALARWVEGAPDEGARARRRERAELAFAANGDDWDAERVLERYELLYEAGLVVEAFRDRRLERMAPPPAVFPSSVPFPAETMPRALGQPMAGDGRRVLATALERLRGKLRYRPIVFELLEPTFTLHGLQRVVEALSGVRVHKQNFRRLMIGGGLVEPTGLFETQTGGRPAELFRYRARAIHERTSTRGARPAP